MTMLDDLLSCRFSPMPPEFFVNIFHVRYNMTIQQRSKACFMQHGLTEQSARTCFRLVSRVCPPTIFLSDEWSNICYATLFQIRADLIKNTSRTTKDPTIAAGDKILYNIVLYQRLLKRYHECMGDMWKKLRPCSWLLEEECQTAKLLLLKTIRLNLAHVIKVAKRDPSIKVVHIVRDPRAMIYSRKKWVRPSVAEVKITCSRLLADIHLSRRLLELNESNYFFLRFEDLAQNPQQSARKLYSFVGADWTQTTTRWLTKHTSAMQDNGDEGTIRRNSSAHLTRWKNDSNVANLFRRAASSECIKMLKHLGYDV